MIFRAMDSADLSECLAIDPRSTGGFIVGRSAALHLWRQLIGHPSFTSAVIEAPAKNGARPIVSFGASLFLTPAWAEHQVQEPRADCNSRLFADISAGKSVIRTDTAEANTSALDLMLLCSSFRHGDLDTEQQAEISALLPNALVQLHAGYRIRRILMETTNEPMRALAAASGLWQTVATFPAENRALMIVTGKEIQASAGFTVLTPLFQYRSPTLGLRSTDKHLLAEAVHGATDSELASSLNLSLSTIKKRWASLFSRVADRRPDLLPELADAARADTRGIQKRHRILNYIRSHPEEIRPYRSYPQA